jgi:hypothetical protein
MTKRAEKHPRTQGENERGAAVGHLVEPMLMGMAATRQERLAWVMRTGWQRWTRCFRTRPLPWPNPRAGITPPGRTITGARRRPSSPSVAASV